MVKQFSNGAEHQWQNAGSEAFFSALSACCPVGIFATDLLGCCTYLNPRFQAICGFSLEESLHQNWQSFIHPDDRESVFLDWAAHTQTGSEFSCRCRVQGQGASQWVQLCSAPLRDQGTLIGYVNTVAAIAPQDSAELQQTDKVSALPLVSEGEPDKTDGQQTAGEREHLLIREQAARIEAEAAKEQIFGILGSITDGFIAFDRQWCFTYLNDEGARTLGRSREELLGKNVWQEFPELAATSFGQLYQRAMAEGVPLELEGYYPPFDAWFAVRAYPSSVGLSLYFRNISERKQAESAIASLNRDLQDRVTELQTLFDMIPIGILISQDLEFKQVRANPAFAHILGISTNANASYTPPQARSTYRILRAGQELTAEETPLRYAAIHNVTIEGTEVDIVRSDGAVFNLFGYAAPLLDDQGNARGSVGAFLDITDRKQAEAEREQLLAREKKARAASEAACAEAEAANRVKDEFLAVLSHELRTPLNPILGWVNLLKAGKLDRQKTQHALETIERNAKLQTQLIEDLLDISRILQGKLTLNVCPVDLAVTIEAAIETVRLAAEAKSLHLSQEIDSSACWMLGDPNRLQQVIWNLLSNAIKFTPARGHIKIKLSRGIQKRGTDVGSSWEPSSSKEDLSASDYAEITVSDTGKGINADFLPYVFDTFRQADGTTTRKFGGLGLGLSIVRQIVELHGGTVAADSPGEGQGATFTVRLPLQLGSAPSQDSRGLNEAINLKGVRVLLVDDEPDARDWVAYVLQRQGAEVIVAASAIQALEALDRTTPDLLLSDIGMPEMDGYGLLHRVKAWGANRGKQIPAIALTAYAGELDRQQSLAAGFQLHLAKPVEPETVVRAVRAVVQPQHH
ncbi:MAG TPA: ATP-binding protein [Coleofasciculaceae cyanobacterium]